MLAESIGYTTVLSHSAGHSETSAAVSRQSINEAVSETARYLVDPAEIMRLSDRQAVILMPRQLRYPVLARKVRYWLERRWRGLWDRWRIELPDPLSAGALEELSHNGFDQITRPEI
jgi:type IV secretion system protein VirD4